MNNSVKKLSFELFGKVQGVMFRQTFIRGAMRRGLQAGASNDPDNQSRVTITLIGEASAVEELVNILSKLEPINSWGARPSSLRKLEQMIPLQQHQVTTENVDHFKWSSGVEMYL